MKVNIILNTTDVRSGYVNIDPFANPQDPTKIQCDPGNLAMIDDNECEELIALDVLDFVNPRDRDNILNHWISKLAHEGSLTIGGREIYDVAKIIFMRAADLNQSNQLLYSSDGSLYRLGLSSVDYVRNTLEGKNLVIDMVKIENCQYIIKAVRK